MGGPHSDPALTTSEPHIRVLKKLILFSGISGCVCCAFSAAIYLFYIISTCHSFFSLSSLFLEGYAYAIISMSFLCLIFSILMLACGYRAKQFLTITFLSCFIILPLAAISIVANIETSKKNCNYGLETLVQNITKYWNDREKDPLKSFFEKYHLENMKSDEIPDQMDNIIDGYSCRKIFPFMTTASVLAIIYTLSIVALIVMVRVYPNKIGVYTDCCIESSNVFGVDYYYSGKKRSQY
ncbi:hypothetical protein TRFO_35880 [Tritrichomonas foetus]|uniref:Uncharacterized protein n=1 Tax=Tritrichomonas foetus TaxID=1144522 RepID=A0A1J4JKR5_9EUKA|nr:hypothetical protein TRFO_35880 [Tritrichomonas foetus]|eukprot:OHS97844.1 hypothetical protein TRFO_35880 [Tritrichomonas foetus]